MIGRLLASVFATLAIVSACRASPPGQPAALYDLVILNGRVIDPASGLDGVRAVGIVGGTIRAVSAETLQGRDTLDEIGRAHV